ncbi:hypothetical protein [Lolliginicoccus suaedae]|uniref:hypothetical protein n=1 Tax=Lolliginicoccus suaedae TaxID=2605429 RepID=UPI0011F00758|nr:hypothetical protein [Lolliginicoccus suaedae]
MKAFTRVAAIAATSAALAIPFAGAASAQPTVDLGGDLGVNLGTGSGDLGAGGGIDLGALLGLGGTADGGANVGGGVEFDTASIEQLFNVNVEGQGGFDLEAAIAQAEADFNAWLESNFGAQGGGTGGGEFNGTIDLEQAWLDFLAQAEADIQAFFGAQGGTNGGGTGGAEFTIDTSSIDALIGGGANVEGGGDLGLDLGTGSADFGIGGDLGAGGGFDLNNLLGGNIDLGLGGTVN